MGTPFSFGLQDRPQTKPIVVSTARKVVAPPLPRPLRASTLQTQGMATILIFVHNFLVVFDGELKD